MREAAPPSAPLLGTAGLARITGVKSAPYCGGKGGRSAGAPVHPTPLISLLEVARSEATSPWCAPFTPGRKLSEDAGRGSCVKKLCVCARVALGRKAGSRRKRSSARQCAPREAPGKIVSIGKAFIGGNLILSKSGRSVAPGHVSAVGVPRTYQTSRAQQPKRFRGKKKEREKKRGRGAGGSCSRSERTCRTR